jgi:Ser-tRNA(Ala) deacylase AlaX
MVELLYRDDPTRNACGGTHVAEPREIGALVAARIRDEGPRNCRVTRTFAT